jgi:MFS family permease
MFRSIRDTLMTKSALRALRHRNFAMVELAGWSAAAGFWFYRIGLQVLTWELTHSGAWLGIVAVAEAIPLFLLLPLGGTLADRFDRLVLARFIQLAVIVVTAMLALVTVMGWINPPLLVVLAAAHGITGAFWLPVRLAMVPNLVPRDDLGAAIALHATLFNLARFLGHALAAPILAVWGVGPAFAVGAACYIPFFVVLFMIELEHTDKRAEPGRKMLDQIKEGFVYAFFHPALKYLFVIILVAAVFGRAYMDLLAGISEAVFSRDPKEAVAIFISAIGLGAIFGSLLLANISRPEALLRAYFICLAANLFFLALFAATHHFWFAVGCAMALSVAMVGMDITSQVMVQITVRGEFRGRAMALWGLFSRSGPALGAVLLGWLSGFIGFQWPILAAVAITALVGYAIFARREAIRAGLEAK